MNSSSNNHEGFTLVELMVVIGIIGILAAIAVPNFLAYRQKGYDSAAISDAKNAFTAAQSYFTEYANKTLSTTAQLNSYGYVPSTNVTVTVSGTQSDMVIQSSHADGTKTYTVDYSGAISF
ncbi:type IV pilin protein [Thermodesulfobacteriota bacterium]